jgi:protein O-mannosyl-transferase
MREPTPHAAASRSRNSCADAREASPAGAAPGKLSAGPDAKLISALLLLSTLPFVNILWNNFVLDDGFQILKNPYVHSFRYLGAIFGKSPWSFQGAQGFANYYRPLMTLQFLMCEKAFGSLAYGFHLASILLHAAVTVVLFLLTVRLFGSRRLALVAAALFAVHPIHTEVVAWASAVPDLQLSLFFLLTLFLFIGPESEACAGEPRAFGWRRQLAMAATFTLALLAKEPAVTLPALAMVYEHFLRADRHRTGTARKVSRYLLLWVLALLYVAFRLERFHGFGPAARRTGLTLQQAVASSLALLPQYFAKLFWPVHLSAYYPFRETASLWSTPALGGVLLVVTCAGVFLLLWRRARPAAFALLWMLLTLAPVLNVRWMAANVFAERYLYLPSVGFCWLVAWAGVGAWSGLPAALRARRWIPAAALTVLLALCAARTFTRNFDWRDTLTIYSRALEVFPDAHVLLGNIGGAYLQRGDLPAAERDLDLAARAAPDDPAVLQNLAVLYSMQKHYARAIAALERMLQLQPDSVSAYSGLANTYWAAGRHDLAVQAARRAVDLAPLNVSARATLGRMYLDLGRLPEAEAQLRRSLEIEPTAEAESMFGEVCYLRGENAEAEQAFRRAVALNPFDSRAQFRLGALCAASGRRSEALRHYQAGLATDPHNPQALAALHALAARDPR